MDLMAVLATLTITIICVFTKGHVSTASAGLALSTLNGVSERGIVRVKWGCLGIVRVSGVEIVRVLGGWGCLGIGEGI